MSGKSYTLREMKDIVKYIVNKRAYATFRGRAMWQEFEQSDKTTRSWQSAKETFLKRILPDIHNPYYELTEEQIKSFRNGRDVCVYSAQKLDITVKEANQKTIEDSTVNNNNKESEPETIEAGEHDDTEDIENFIIKTEPKLLTSSRHSIDTVIIDEESLPQNEAPNKKNIRDCITYTEPLTPMMEDIHDTELSRYSPTISTLSDTHKDTGDDVITGNHKEKTINGSHMTSDTYLPNNQENMAGTKVVNESIFQSDSYSKNSNSADSTANKKVYDTLPDTILPNNQEQNKQINTEFTDDSFKAVESQLSVMSTNVNVDSNDIKNNHVETVTYEGRDNVIRVDTPVTDLSSSTNPSLVIDETQTETIGVKKNAKLRTKKITVDANNAVELIQRSPLLNSHSDGSDNESLEVNCKVDIEPSSDSTIEQYVVKGKERRDRLANLFGYKSGIERKRTLRPHKRPVKRRKSDSSDYLFNDNSSNLSSDSDDLQRINNFGLYYPKSSSILPLGSDGALMAVCAGRIYPLVAQVGKKQYTLSKIPNGSFHSHRTRSRVSSTEHARNHRKRHSSNTSRGSYKRSKYGDLLREDEESLSSSDERLAIEAIKVIKAMKKQQREESSEAVNNTSDNEWKNKFLAEKKKNKKLHEIVTKILDKEKQSEDVTEGSRKSNLEHHRKTLLDQEAKPVSNDGFQITIKSGDKVINLEHTSVDIAGILSQLIKSVNKDEKHEEVITLCSSRASSTDVKEKVSKLEKEIFDTIKQIDESNDTSKKNNVKNNGQTTIDSKDVSEGQNSVNKEIVQPSRTRRNKLKVIDTAENENQSITKINDDTKDPVKVATTTKTKQASKIKINEKSNAGTNEAVPSKRMTRKSKSPSPSVIGENVTVENITKRNRRPLVPKEPTKHILSDSESEIIIVNDGKTCKKKSPKAAVNNQKKQKFKTKLGQFGGKAKTSPNTTLELNDNDEVRYMLPEMVAELQKSSTGNKGNTSKTRKEPVKHYLQVPTYMSGDSSSDCQDTDVSPSYCKPKRRKYSRQLNYRQRSKSLPHFSPTSRHRISSSSCFLRAKKANSINFNRHYKKAYNNTSSCVYEASSYRDLFSKGLCKQASGKIPTFMLSPAYQNIDHSPPSSTTFNDVKTERSDSSIIPDVAGNINSSYITLPVSPELSLVEKITISSQCVSNLCDNINKNFNDDITMETFDVTLSPRDVEMKDLMTNDNNNNKSETNFIKFMEPDKNCVSSYYFESLENKYSGTLTESFQNKFGNLQLNTPKAKRTRKSKAIKISADDVSESDANAKKKRCSTPHKKKKIPKAKTTPHGFNIIEHSEFCKKLGRQQSPERVETVQMGKEKHFTKKSVRQKNTKSAHICQDITTKKSKSDICLPTNNLKCDYEPPHKLCNEDEIHNHSDTCLTSMECFDTYIEDSLLGDNNTLPFVDDNKLLPDMCSMEGYKINGCLLDLCNINSGECSKRKKHKCEETFNKIRVERISPSTNSQNSEILHSTNRNSWFLFSDDESSEIPSNNGDKELIAKYGNHLTNLFPVACQIPDLSTINEDSQETMQTKMFRPCDNISSPSPNEFYSYSSETPREIN